MSSGNIKIETIFWDNYSIIENMKNTVHWEDVINRLRNLRVFANEQKLSPVLQSKCLLKIAEIRANYGGIGNKREAVHTSRIALELLSQNLEPELKYNILKAQGVALHVLGANLVAKAIFEEALDIIHTYKLPRKREFDIRREIAQCLYTFGYPKLAKKELIYLLQESLDKSFNRDILLNCLRLTEACIFSDEPKNVEYNLQQFEKLMTEAQSSISQSELNRIKVIASRIKSHYLIRYEDKYTTYSILQEALQSARIYGYAFQESKLLKLISLVN